MEIEYFNSELALAKKAAGYIMAAVRDNPKLLLGTATGNTPTLTYQHLVAQKQLFPSDQLRIFKLDEWGGVPAAHPGTCETYLQNELVKPLEISSDRYYSFHCNPENPQQECARVQQMLQQEGPLDLCVLGLGVNGHLAFNEPADFLQPHCHVARLTQDSLGHSMAREMQQVQLYGLTLGMRDILASKTILLLISGESKVAVTKRFLEGKISTWLPASFLHLHQDVRVLIY